MIEQPFLEHELLTGAGRHQNDIDNSLPNDLTNLLPIVIERLKRVGVGRDTLFHSGSGDAEPHVGILGVGNNELSRPVRIAMNISQLGFE